MSDDLSINQGLQADGAIEMVPASRLSQLEERVARLEQQLAKAVYLLANPNDHAYSDKLEELDLSVDSAEWSRR